MNDQLLAFSEKISDIKKKWKLIPCRKIQFNVEKFKLISKGDALRIRYTWQCPDISPNTYLIKYNNSHRINVVKPGIDYQPLLNVSEYLGCYIAFEHDFPDFIIRPKNIADQLFNMFFKHQIKVKSSKQFNNKYMLESGDTNIIENRLGKTLFDLIFETDEIHIEMSENKCLLFFLEPIWVNSQYDNMLQIAEELNKISKGLNL